MFYIFVLLACWATPLKGLSKEDPVPAYDEILVFLNVQGIGTTQVSAAIVNDTAYLSVTNIFDFLKIKNTPGEYLDSITGFVSSPQAAFTINKKNNSIVYQEKTFILPPNSLIHSATGLYLRSDYFGEIFGLHCRFNFRNLSVILSTSIELPVLREMRLEAMRTNLMQLRGEVTADTTIDRRYNFFKLGMSDWSVINTKDLSNGYLDTRLHLALGGILAGGETNIAFNYRNNFPFREREQFYQWRYVDNNNRLFKQARVGKIFTPSISSIFSPVIGVQITNNPAIYRRSFGTYTLTYHIEAGWTAELYVNNTLVDYSKAEVTGITTFQVPLVYGSSQVKIRFYSPWGEEKISEQNIEVPFNFLPQREFEYTVSAGMVEDSLHSRFSRINGNYGLTGRLTVGGGVEYLSSVRSGTVIPFANASFRVSAKLLVAGEYSYGVRSKLAGTYRTKSDILIEFNYTRYKQRQKAINNTFLEERKATVSFPLRKKNFALFSRLSLYQVILPSTQLTTGKVPGSKYTTAEALISGVVWGINTNLSTYGLFIGKNTPYVYSNLTTTFRLPGKLICSPQLQYEYSKFKIISIKGEVGRYLNTRGYVNIFYENNIKSNFQNTGVGLRYDFSFAMTGLSLVKGNHGRGALVQSASGSLLYDDESKKMMPSNRNSVGRGLITILPYLDINANGKRDAGEPRVQGINVRINGGRIRHNKNDTTITISDLEAYAGYMVTLSESFENIAWHLTNKTVSITVDPNQFKLVEIPVKVIHEVTGSVSNNDQQKRLARVIVSFYHSDFSLAGEAVTEADGTFSYNSLPPGDYFVQVNTTQLEKMKMKTTQRPLRFTIAANKNGDVIDGLDLIVEAK